MSPAYMPRALAPWSVFGCLLLALSACGGKPAPEPASPAAPSPSTAAASDAPADPSTPQAAAPADPASAPAAAPATNEPEVSQIDPGDSGAFQLGPHHAKPIIDANRPFLNRTCWAAAVKNKPHGPAKIKLAIEVEVQPDGKVTKVAMVGGKDYEGFASCVEKHVKRWRWPKAKAVSSLMFPIEFTHGDVEWREKEQAK